MWPSFGFFINGLKKLNHNWINCYGMNGTMHWPCFESFDKKNAMVGVCIFGWICVGIGL